MKGFIYILLDLTRAAAQNATLGTGHKVFTRGCGRYFLGGVRKNPRNSEGGTKKTTEPLGGGDQNVSLSTIGTEKNYIL